MAEINALVIAEHDNAALKSAAGFAASFHNR